MKIIEDENIRNKIFEYIKILYIYDTRCRTPIHQNISSITIKSKGYSPNYYIYCNGCELYIMVISPDIINNRNLNSDNNNKFHSD